MKKNELKTLIKEQIKSILNEGADWILLKSINKLVDEYQGHFYDASDPMGDEVLYGDRKWKKLYAKLSPNDKSIVDSITKELEDENINEEFSMADQPNPDYVQELVDVATNEAKFYDSKDAKGAVSYAKKILIKEKVDDMLAEFDKATPKAIQDVIKYWKNN
jgi:hypothetical protein